jgi:hypothetical protein
MSFAIIGTRKASNTANQVVGKRTFSAGAAFPFTNERLDHLVLGYNLLPQNRSARYRHSNSAICGDLIL